MSTNKSQRNRTSMVLAIFAGLALSTGASAQDTKPPRLVRYQYDSNGTSYVGGGAKTPRPRLIKYGTGSGGGGNTGGGDTSGGGDPGGVGGDGGSNKGGNGGGGGGGGGGGDGGGAIGGGGGGGGGSGGGGGGDNFDDPGPFTWTDLTPAQDSRLIYVSSSTGSDSNPGTIDRPVKTVSQARGMTRSNFPDWILLKSGEEFQGGIFGKGGRGPDEPWVITSYGEGPRPIINGVPDLGCIYIGGANSYAAIVNVHLKAPDEGTSMDGIRSINQPQTSHILIENCVVEDFRNGMNIQHGSFVSVRGNVIIDTAAPNGGHAQGIFVDGVDDLLIEGNVLDHNGWREDGLADPTIFNHNCYTKGTGDDPLVRPIIRNNIFARGSSFGLSMSTDFTGGVIDPIIEGNLFLANANGFVHGAGHVSSIRNTTVRRNVFMQHGRVLSTGRQAFGMELNSIDGGLIEQNYFLDTDFGGSTFSIRLHRGPQSDLVIRDNVSYEWLDGGFDIAGEGLENVSFVSNVIADPTDSWTLIDMSGYSRMAVDFSGNAYQLGGGLNQSRFRLNSASMDFDTWRVTADEPDAVRAESLGFADPDRTIDTYMQSIGRDGGLEEFLLAARNQRRGAWDQALTAEAVVSYIEEGFQHGAQ